MADPKSDVLDRMEISERSKKFYTGQYRFNDSGFEDESGVFRLWGDTSEGPPTPLPPRSLSDTDIDSSDEIIPTGAQQPAMTIFHGPLEFNYAALPPGSSPPVPHPALNQHFVSKYTRYDPRAQPASPDTNVRVDGSGLESVTYHKTLLKDGLFADLPEPERQLHLGRVEGFMIGGWYYGAQVSMEEAYGLVGVPFEGGELSAATSLVEMKHGERRGGAVSRGRSRERTLTASPGAHDGFAPGKKHGKKRVVKTQAHRPGLVPGSDDTAMMVLDSTDDLPVGTSELAEEIGTGEPDVANTPDTKKSAAKKKGVAIKKKATPAKKKSTATDAKSDTPPFPRLTSRQWALTQKKEK